MKADPNRSYSIPRKPFHYSFTLFEVKKEMESVFVPIDMGEDEHPAQNMYGLWSYASKRAMKTTKEVEKAGNDFIFLVKPENSYSFVILETPGLCKLRVDVVDKDGKKSDFLCYATKETVKSLISN